MNKEKYASNWQWFNALVTNVELTEEQLKGMFNNLTPAELEVWIAEVKDCYLENDGVEQIATADDLARHYYNNPITE